MDVRTVFVGRDRELTVLADHLAHARAGRSQVVVVEGDPGTGKTALVQAFLDGLDAGVGVLWAGGEEAEEQVSYGVVEQLARAVERVGASGPAVDVRPSDEPPVVGAALVALLDRLRGREGPVVVVVDDGHWADVPSVQALVFALRRLGSDRVLTLVAARPLDGGRIDRLRALAAGDRGRTLRLGGLGVDGLVALGRALGTGELPPRAAQRLLAHTGGVPLHARALFEEVDPAVLRSVEGPLPSPTSYAVLVLGRLSQCPPGARAVVAAAAVLGERCRLADAVDLAGEAGAEVVAPAVTAKLVTTGPAPHGTALRFPHALIRAAIYHDLDLADRMALHARAARIVDAPDEVLRHRVAAAGGSDPALAAELHALAAEQVGRGERSRAAATLISAAGLYPDAADRSRSLLDAIELLVLAGERSRATELARAVPGGGSAHDRFVRGVLAFTAGRTAEAEQLLLASWAAADDADPGFRAGICDALCHLYYLQLRAADSVKWGSRALAVDPRQSVSLVTSLALAGRSIAPTAELATAVARGARVVLVARAGADPAPGAAERALDEVPGEQRRDLVVLHPAGTATPTGTAAWLSGRAVTRHHHVRDRDRGDLDRVARFLSGTARGLVLAGGGARGFAHLGVMQAVDEAGIPVDAVGGASIGAIMAGFYAAGLDHEQRLHQARRAMVDQGSMVGFTLPLVAVSSGRKVTRLLREEPSFAGTIEDLWLPYFCVSASLSQAREIVHERGETWRAIRSSIAIPGVFPPVHDGTQLLVDGGVMNNLPIDVMAGVVGDGPILAVNLQPGGGGGRRPPAEFDLALSGWRVLASRLNPFTPRMRVPRIGDVVVRSMSLSTARLQRDRLAGRSVELLTPPVGRSGLLDFRAGPGMVEPAYRYAVEALAQSRVVVGP